MKSFKSLLISIAILMFVSVVSGQVPHGINYKAILRDASNNIIINTAIDVKFGLITDSPAGTLIWEEQHSATTNDFGMFSLLVGDENASRTGGTHAAYTDIIWGANPMYLKVSINYGGSWKEFDPELINSSPFALVSKSAEDDNDRDPDNEIIETLVLNGTSLEITEAGTLKTADLSSLKDSPFSVNSDTVSLVDEYLSIGAPNPGRSKVAIISQDDLSEDALFEVKRSDGQTVFAVYNEGVRIFLPTDPLTKGPKGGFAIGGFDRTKGAYTEDYMWVTPDSIRMYFDNTPDGKGPKGGFAIGGFDRTKAEVGELMVLNADSTRFYIDDTGSKGLKGGFAIGGFDQTKGFRQDYMRVTVDSTRIFVNDSTAGFAISSLGSTEAKSFMDLTTENYFIGHESGNKVVPSGSSGKYNSFLGYQAGKNTVSGRMNVALGYKAGINNDADFNVFMGNEAGRINNGDYNMFMGHQSGYNNNNGNGNLFMGYNAGKENISGNSNILLGYSAGSNNETGDDNIFIGKLTGTSSTSGSNNIVLGNQAMNTNVGGSDNVIIGYMAGYYTGHPSIEENATGNVMIGYKAGYYNYYSNKLYIDNSDTFDPLIYGDFADGSELVKINGDLQHTGTLSQVSDKRLKRDISVIGNFTDKLSKIRPVYFYWDRQSHPELVVNDRRQIGLIAQEVEDLFPELVQTNGDGYLTVDYTKLPVILLGAIQSQQGLIKDQQERLDDLQEKYDCLLKQSADMANDLRSLQESVSSMINNR
ncbi:MAG: tail fiber domain-containing protein [Bacteroidales bacterium]|nr:tail fiber domain-containing protein [Bacteroidales bacterium]